MLSPPLLSCGTDASPTATENEASGALELSTVTTGDDRDPDGYTVTIVGVRFDVRCEGRGTLEVTTATVAGGLDENGFQVAMDGGAARTIGTDDTETFTSVATGDRTVELTGLATGCSVSGDNPRTVTLTADETETVAFDVR